MFFWEDVRLLSMMELLQNHSTSSPPDCILLTTIPHEHRWFSWWEKATPVNSQAYHDVLALDFTMMFRPMILQLLAKGELHSGGLEADFLGNPAVSPTFGGGVVGGGGGIGGWWWW